MYACQNGNTPTLVKTRRISIFLIRLRHASCFIVTDFHRSVTPSALSFMKSLLLFAKKFCQLTRATALLGALAFSMSSGWGQIVYQHNFGTTTITGKPYTAAPTTFNANLSSSSWTTSASGFTSFAGSSGQALSLNDSSGTPTYTLTFDVASGYTLDVSSLAFWRQRSTSGAQNYSITINGGAAIASGTVPTTGANTGTLTVSGKTGLTGTVTLVITLSSASGTGTFRLDDFTINGTVTSTSPTITATGTPGAVNTTYGSASPSPSSFSISGANMTAGISVNPPAHYQVSTTSDFSANTGTNGSPITVGGSGTISSTTI